MASIFHNCETKTDTVMNYRSVQKYCALLYTLLSPFRYQLDRYLTHHARWVSGGAVNTYILAEDPCDGINIFQ